MTEIPTTEQEALKLWGYMREEWKLLGYTHPWAVLLNNKVPSYEEPTAIYDTVKVIATRHCVRTDHKWKLKSCVGCNPPE